jgi:hypothetical protein
MDKDRFYSNGSVVVEALCHWPEGFGFENLLSEYKQNKTTNSVLLVSERTIPTWRPPLVGEVSANVCG